MADEALKKSYLSDLIDLLDLREGPDGRLIIPTQSDIIAKGQSVTLREAMLLKLNYTGLKVNPFYDDHPHAKQLADTFPFKTKQIAAGKNLSSPSPSISVIRGNILAVEKKFLDNDRLAGEGLSLESTFADVNKPENIKETALQDRKTLDKASGKELRKPGSKAAQYLIAVSEQLDTDLSLYGGEGLKQKIHTSLRAVGGSTQSRGTKKPKAFPEPKGPLKALMDTIKEMPDEVARNAALLRTVIPFRGAHEVYDIQVYDPAKWDNFEAFLEHTKKYKEEIVPYYRIDQPDVINIAPEGMTRGKKSLSPKRLTPFLKNLILDQIASNTKNGTTGHSLFPDLTERVFNRNLKAADMEGKFHQFYETIGRDFKNASDFRKIAPSVLLGIAQKEKNITGAEISEILSHQSTDELIEGMKKVTGQSYAAGLSVDELVPFRVMEAEIAKALEYDSVNKIASYVSEPGSFENNKNNHIELPTRENVTQVEPTSPRPSSPEDIQVMAADSGASKELRDQLNEEKIADSERKVADTRLKTRQTTLEIAAANEELAKKGLSPTGKPLETATGTTETPVETQTDELLQKDGIKAEEKGVKSVKYRDRTFASLSDNEQKVALGLQAEANVSGDYRKLNTFLEDLDKADASNVDLFRGSSKMRALLPPVIGGLVGAKFVLDAFKAEAAPFVEHIKPDEAPTLSETLSSLDDIPWEITAKYATRLAEEFVSPLPVTTQDVADTRKMQKDPFYQKLQEAQTVLKGMGERRAMPGDLSQEGLKDWALGQEETAQKSIQQMSDLGFTPEQVTEQHPLSQLTKAGMENIGETFSGEVTEISPEEQRGLVDSYAGYSGIN